MVIYLSKFLLNKSIKNKLMKNEFINLSMEIKYQRILVSLFTQKFVLFWVWVFCIDHYLSLLRKFNQLIDSWIYQQYTSIA